MISCIGLATDVALTEAGAPFGVVSMCRYTCESGATGATSEGVFYDVDPLFR